MRFLTPALRRATAEAEARAMESMRRDFEQRADAALAQRAADGEPRGWGDVLAQLAHAQRENADLRAQRSRDRERIARMEAQLERYRELDIARMEAQLERYRELDIARERAHGYGGFEGRPHKPAAHEPGPYEVFPTTRPAASPITDRSQPDGTGEQPRTEVP